MQRRSVLLFVSLVALAFAAALMRKRAAPEPESALPGSGPPVTELSAAASSSTSQVAPLAPTVDPLGEPEAPTPLEPPLPSAGQPSEPASADSLLPADAPRQVGFGVVLIEYRGAQGATKAARSRAEAAAKAEELRALADKDFASAVKSGDKGSMDNAGSMPRGILEPGPERVLFSLRVGEVGGPVDTPRGYWVVKRLE
jgi:parvulin-like peptidyl-prolyl isomerase